MKKYQTVVAVGAFDGIHPGHESFLEQAKKLGKELIVLVARDAKIEKYKGRRPRRSENERLNEVKKLTMVDKAMLGGAGDDYLEMITKILPDVLALGYDQWPTESDIKADLKERRLGKIKIVRLKPYRPDEFHSSLLADQ